MSRDLTHIVACDAPKCGTAYSVGPSGRPVPEGWWHSDQTIRGVDACPRHAAEARAAEEALHEWDRARIKAQNAWVRKHPAPEVAEWLEDIIP